MNVVNNGELKGHPFQDLLEAATQASGLQDLPCASSTVIDEAPILSTKIAQRAMDCLNQTKDIFEGVRWEDGLGASFQLHSVFCACVVLRALEESREEIPDAFFQNDESIGRSPRDVFIRMMVSAVHEECLPGDLQKSVQPYLSSVIKSASFRGNLSQWTLQTTSEGSFDGQSDILKNILSNAISVVY